MNQPDSEMTWKTLGECLEKSRRKQNLSLHDVAAALRLPSRTIQAIEQGRCDDLPAIYLRGHVHRYLSLLNRQDRSLDQLNLDDLWCETASDQHSVAIFDDRLPTALPGAPTHRVFDKVLRVASYLVVTAGVIIPLVWWFTEGAVRMSFDESLVNSAPPLLENEANADIADNIDDKVASIRPGHLNASAAPFASMRPQPRQSVTDNAVVLTGESMFKDLFEATSTMPHAIPPYRYGSTAVPEHGRYAATSAAEETALPARLHLHMLNDSWVEITDADGERIEFDLLRTGQSHQYQVRLPLDILIGKASAVDIMLNGAAVDLSPHTRGNVAKLTLADETSAN